jgi:hypothetical protein
MIFYWYLQFNSGKRIDFGFRYAPKSQDKFVLINGDNIDQQRQIEAKGIKQLTQGNKEPRIRWL